MQLAAKQEAREAAAQGKIDAETELQARLGGAYQGCRAGGSSVPGLQGWASGAPGCARIRAASRGATVFWLWALSGWHAPRSPAPLGTPRTPQVAKIFAEYFAHAWEAKEAEVARATEGAHRAEVGLTVQAAPA